MLERTTKVYLDTVPFEIKGRAVALGLFDGIHAGHAPIIMKAVKAAKQNGLKSTVMTFSGSVKGEKRYITSLEERLDILSQFGVDEMLVLDFDSIKDLDHNAFCEEILRNKLNAKALFAGDDFRYGKGALGNCETLKAFGSDNGIAVKIFKALLLPGTDRRISSSWIKEALDEGDAALASKLLGDRPFYYTGIVTKGKQLGRQLGFPTANLIIPEDKLTVRRGVYASRLTLGKEVYNGVTNVGRRPTFDDSDADTVETYIFDFDEDIYGARIKVELLEFLRPETRFTGPEELAQTVASDKINAKTYHDKRGIMSE